MSEDLIERIRKAPGDERRWAAWYKATYPRLSYFAFRLMSGDAEAARDLVQEAFTRFVAYRAIERVSNDNHALAFLLTTCRNLAADAGAKVQHVPEQALEGLELMAAADQKSEPALDLDRLQAALEPESRQLIQWAREGLTVAEIAKRLGITYTAAGVRLHRIRKRLQELHLGIREAEQRR